MLHQTDRQRLALLDLLSEQKKLHFINNLSYQMPADCLHEERPGAVPGLWSGAYGKVSPEELWRTQIISCSSGELS